MLLICLQCLIMAMKLNAGWARLFAERHLPSDSKKGHHPTQHGCESALATTNTMLGRLRGLLPWPQIFHRVLFHACDLQVQGIARLPQTRPEVCAGLYSAALLWCSLV